MPENGQKVVAPLENHPLSSAFIDAIENTHPSVPSLFLSLSQDKLPCHVLRRTDGRTDAVHVSFVAVDAVVTRRNERGEIDDNHPE